MKCPDNHDARPITTEEGEGLEIPDKARGEIYICFGCSKTGYKFLMKTPQALLEEKVQIKEVLAEKARQAAFSTKEKEETKKEKGL